MQNESLIRPSEERRPSRTSRKIVVVADDGGSASLVLLDTTHPAHVGSCFHHRGQRWIIRGQRDPSGVLVAEPLAQA